MSRLLTVLGTVLVVGTTACSRSVEQALPSSVPELTTAQNVEVKDPTGGVLLKGTFATTSDKPSGMEKTAELTPVDGTAVKGKADIDVERDNGVTKKDELVVTAKELPKSMELTLVVDGQTAATFTTPDSGRVHITLTRKVASR